MSNNIVEEPLLEDLYKCAQYFDSLSKVLTEREQGPAFVAIRDGYEHLLSVIQINHGRFGPEMMALQESIVQAVQYNELASQYGMYRYSTVVMSISEHNYQSMVFSIIHVPAPHLAAAGICQALDGFVTHARRMPMLRLVS